MAGDGEEAVYEEKHRFTGFIIAMLVISAVHMVVLVGGIYKASLSFIVLSAVLLALFAFLLAGFHTLVFRITSEEVVFGFPIYKKRFSLESVQSCEPYKLTFANYLGYGIRTGIQDGTVAYNTRNGDGIRMAVEGASRDYVVSVDDPPHVCDLLNAE